MFILTSILLIGLCACQKPDPSQPSDPLPPSEDDPSIDDPPATEDLITLVADGVSEYRITYSDFANDYVKSEVIRLRNAIETVTGVKLTVVTDWEDQANNDDIKEILVGKTNRAASTDLAKKLGDSEYGVAISGNKISLGGSQTSLSKAVTAFLATYLGYQNAETFDTKATVTLPKEVLSVQSIYSDRTVALYITNQDLRYVDALAKSLRDAFGNVTVASLNTPPSEIFDANTHHLVVVAGVNTIPASFTSKLQGYLENGGRVLMLGGPAFKTTLYEYQGEWFDFNDYIETLIKDLEEDEQQVIMDTFSSSLINRFAFSSDNNTPSKTQLGNYGLKGSSRQFFHEVENLSSWATLALGVKVDMKDANVISFYAKPGDDHTDSFTLEVEESNGSRWYTAVPFIGDDWEHYAYLASDFTWFDTSTSTPARGATPDLSDITKIRIGFADSHARTTDGHHSYYVSDIKVSKLDTDLIDIMDNNRLVLDGVSPLYEQYPITNGANIVTDANQVIVTERDYVLPSEIISRHPGLTGIGYDKDTRIRFIPLLRVTDEKGLHSGYAAWIDLYATHTNHNSKQEGSMVGYFSAVSEDFYNADGIAAVTEAAVAMTRNVFLVDGGTTEYTYLASDKEDIVAGLKYVTLKGQSPKGNLIATVALYKGDKVLAEYSSEKIDMLDLKNSIKALQGSYARNGEDPDRVVATLTLDGEVIDRLEHDVHFWSPKPLEERKYIYIEDGYFKRDGEIISFFGVNYMPSYAAARPENDNNFYSSTTYQSLTANGAYDPTVIHYDLARIKDIGMNAVALWGEIQYLKECNNVLDLARICEELGLYVDLSIRPTAYPLQKYSESDVETLIHRLQFHENDNIIAFDIAWEPRIGNYDGSWTPGHKYGPHYFIGRDHWDDEFTAWTALQYGSIEAAEQAWGVKLERNAKGDLLLSDAMLDDTTGKYQKAVAAYYRFIDDIVSAQMQEKMLHMEPLAPNQLISFRMSMSGSAYRTSSFLPSTHCFDFQSLATTMDFMEPEGYQLGTSEIQALQIMFANAYARYTKPDAPVVWKEYGRHVWPGHDDANFAPSEVLLQTQADYYRYALEYALNSYTSGMFCWTSYGGYRTDEKSDYGIFNPDGSDRPATLLMREYAPKIIGQGERQNEVFIALERDDHVGGIFGMFDAVKDELAAAFAAGKTVTFINATQHENGDHAYADTLLDYAIADAKPENGTYPLRYVNGMIKDFRVVSEDGKTYAEVTVCNTKQSIWRAGTVSVVSTAESDIAVDCTIDAEVGYLENTTVKLEISGKGDVALRFEINGIPFGPLYTATVK
ncbi:MAG: hypothetical protein J6R04_02755 [Clostridia bacterium]|nr:hypothetical protein [Clostridia bacterium]